VKVSISAIWVLAACSIGLVGCGSDDDKGTGETGSEAEPLEVFSWWTQPGEAEALDALFDLYRKNFPHRSIFNAAEKSGPTAKQVLGERLDAGDPPDLFQQNAYEMRAFLQVHPGSVTPIDDVFTSEGLNETVAPEVIDNVTIDGKVYAIPVNAHRENSLFYNAGILADHQLEPPKTLDDFLSVCKTLKAAGITPVAVSTSQSWIVSKLFIGLSIGSFGGQAFHDYFSGETPLDEQAMGNAIDVLDQVLTEYIDVDQAQADGYGWTECVRSVFDGDAAMFLHGDWAKASFEALGWAPNVDFGVVGSPGASEVFLYGTDVFGIPTGAKHESEARDFARTVLSKEGQIAFNSVKGSSPIRLDVPLSAFDPMAQQVIGDFKSAKLRMALKWQNAWDEALGAFAHDHDKQALLQAFKDNAPQ
jgi:glucose/mannose transport system substrate-binding protein